MRVTWIRKTHRYLGLVIGLQLLLWTVSGFYFSWNNIEQVRGEHLATGPIGLAPGDISLVSPQVVITAFMQRDPEIEMIQQITLRTLLNQPVYEVKYRADGDVHYALADAHTGVIMPPIERSEAVSIAQADFAPGAPVRSVELVKETSEGSEYRSGELPAYLVEFDHPSGTRIYVSARRGLVTARRNDTWRVFDFLWMFHIMDYNARDDINNALLRILSILGIFTVLSGFSLWMGTLRVFRRLRNNA